MLNWILATAPTDAPLKLQAGADLEAEGRWLISESPVLFAGAAWNAYEREGRGLFLLGLGEVDYVRGSVTITYAPRAAVAAYFASLPIGEWLAMIDGYDPRLDFVVMFLGPGDDKWCSVLRVRPKLAPPVAYEQCAKTIAALEQAPRQFGDVGEGARP